MNKNTTGVIDRHTYTVPRKHSGTPLATKQRPTKVTPFEFSDTKSKRHERFSCCSSSVNHHQSPFVRLPKPSCGSVGSGSALSKILFANSYNSCKDLERFSPIGEASSSLEVNVEVSLQDGNHLQSSFAEVAENTGSRSPNENGSLLTLDEEYASVCDDDIRDDSTSCTEQCSFRPNFESRSTQNADQVESGEQTDEFIKKKFESDKQFKQRKAHVMYRRIFRLSAAS